MFLLLEFDKVNHFPTQAYPPAFLRKQEGGLSCSGSEGFFSGPAPIELRPVPNWCGVTPSELLLL